VRQRARGWQADFRWEGQRLRETLKTEAAAWDWIKASRDALQKGDALVVQGKVVMKTVDNAVTAAGDSDLDYYTVDKLVQFTYDLHWAGTNNAKDAHRNAKDVASVHGGLKHPRTLTGRAVLDLVAKLKVRGVANATINRKLSALATMLKYGHKRGVVPTIPELPWQPEDNARCRFFTEEEERKVIDWFERNERRDMRDLFIVLVDTGMRLNEALGLTTRDIERYEAGRAIRVWGNVRASRKKESAKNKRTKNGESQSVPITQRVAELLDARRAALPDGEARLFHPLIRHTAENWWVKLREGIGMADDPAFVLHTCRHTFASRLAQRGATDRELMLVGGWKTVQMVQRYSHLRPEDAKAVVAKLEGGFNPLSQPTSVVNR
jgi:integrase